MLPIASLERWMAGALRFARSESDDLTEAVRRLGLDIVRI